MDVVIVDLGLALLLLGALCLIRPLPRLGVSTRRRAALALTLGVAVLTLGLLLPVSPPRRSGARMLLDEVAPVYEFGERHQIGISASRDRVQAAVRAVTAREIRGFRLLTWLRSPRLPGRGREGILNPVPDEPILEVALRSGFVLLRDEPGREIVLGTVICCGPRSPPRASDFLAPSGSRVLAVMNFHLSDGEGATTRLVTETRVHATDDAARRRFAAYWRLIYPGSDLIRRAWLQAIRRKAEGASGPPP